LNTTAAKTSAELACGSNLMRLEYIMAATAPFGVGIAFEFMRD